MKNLPSADLAHDVIESIVSLTEQRDQRSLEQSLFATLEEMLDGVEAWLLDIPEAPGGESDCVMLHGQRNHLPTALLEKGCHLSPDKTSQLVEHDGLTYYLARLTGSQAGRQHLLFLAQKNWPDIDVVLVKGMLQVYQNFIGVLYDSEKDTLTGLYNRRKLDSKLKEIASARLQGRRLSDKAHADFLCILDLDRFKRINDAYGHLIGDEVLLIFANILRQTLRDSDLIFRYGGEEFIVLLQDIDPATVADVLGRIRFNVERHVFPQVGQVTVSIGYTILDNHMPPTQSLENADRALYYAKDNGRNQVCDYSQLVAEGKLANTRVAGSIELF